MKTHWFPLIKPPIRALYISCKDGIGGGRDPTLGDFGADDGQDLNGGPPTIVISGVFSPQLAIYFRPFIGLITSLIIGRGPPCKDR